MKSIRGIREVSSIIRVNRGSSTNNTIIIKRVARANRSRGR